MPANVHSISCRRHVGQRGKRWFPLQSNGPIERVPTVAGFSRVVTVGRAVRLCPSMPVAGKGARGGGRAGRHQLGVLAAKAGLAS
jgi:hypothetical protein